MAISSVFEPALRPEEPKPALVVDPATQAALDQLAILQGGQAPLPPPPSANVPAVGPPAATPRDQAFEAYAAAQAQPPPAPAPAPEPVAAAQQQLAQQPAATPAAPPAGPVQAAQAALAPAKPAAPAKPIDPLMTWKGSLDERMEAARLAGDADQDIKAAQAAYWGERGDMLGRHDAEMQRRQEVREGKQAERNAAVDTAMGQLDAQVQELRNTHIDTGRLFRNPGGALMAMGAAMGGGAAARVTGRNEGMAALESFLQRDFDAQKADASNKATALAGKQNLVATMRASYADRDQADRAAELAYRDIAATQLEALAARSKVPEIQAEGKKLAAEMRDKLQVMRDTYRKEEAARAAARQAAKEHAEDRAWRMRKDVTELGLKRDELRLKELEAKGKLNDQEQKEREDLSKRIVAAGIPEGVAAAQRASADLAQGGSLLNTNPLANALAEKFPAIYKFAMGDDAAASQQSYSAFASALGKQIFGAVSKSDADRMKAMLEGAGTPGARRAAIANALEIYNASRSAIEAGSTKRAVEGVRAREQATGPTTSTNIEGFTAGTK